MSNKDKGYISLYRSIQDHKLYPHNRAFTLFEAWIDLLMKANHKDVEMIVEMSIKTINRGDILTSEVKLSGMWRWSRTKVRDFLRLLESDEMIIKKSTSKYTIITICNYDNYQCVKTSEKHQKNIRKTSEKHQKNTNNNDNNENNDNKKTITFEIFWNLYDKKTGREKCEKKWNNLTQAEKEMIIEKLPKYLATISDKKYQKDPLTYLNGKYWNDELEQPMEKEFINPFIKLLNEQGTV
jgi:hypothetical protein